MDEGGKEGVLMSKSSSDPAFIYVIFFSRENSNYVSYGGDCLFAGLFFSSVGLQNTFKNKKTIHIHLTFHIDLPVVFRINSLD